MASCARPDAVQQKTPPDYHTFKPADSSDVGSRVHRVAQGVGSPPTQ